MELSSGGDSLDWIFLAMAHWKLGDKEQDEKARRQHKEEARRWYDKAVKWMDGNQPDDEELRRFHTEAAELLGVTEEDVQPREPQQDTAGEPPDEQ